MSLYSRCPARHLLEPKGSRKTCPTCGAELETVHLPPSRDWYDREPDDDVDEETTVRHISHDA